MQEVANPRFESRPAWSMNQGWADNDFLTPDPHPMKFLNIHIQSLSKNFWNFVSDIHPYSNATLVNAKQTGSGYTSTSGPSFLKTYSSIACNMTLKLYAHGMRPMRFLSECVWFRDVTSFSDSSGMVCVRELTHQTQCSDSLLLERRPYQMHQKRTWRHEIRRILPKNAQDACRVHPAWSMTSVQ